MQEISRLAVLETGGPAVRILAAVGNLNRETDRRIASVIVVPPGAGTSWFAREADEVLTVSATDPDQLVRALTDARIDAVWPAPWGDIGHADLVAACEQAGIGVVGAGSEVIRRLADSTVVAEIAERIGVPHELEQPAEELRTVDVEVIADRHGGCWSLTRESTIRLDGDLILTESPVPFLRGHTERDLVEAAQAAVQGESIVGSAVVTFAVSTDGKRFWLRGIDPLARPEHGLVESATGGSRIGHRLAAATGARLGDQPVGEGAGIEVRLLARDVERENAPVSGRVERFVLPVGHGVRVNPCLAEGDDVDAKVDPVLATFAAWGRDREEARNRLWRAIARSTVVVAPGSTNRSALLSLLDAREFIDGPVTGGWLPGLRAAGDLEPPADPLALVAGAVEAYEAELAAARGAFFASARRGRPQNPEAVGSQVHLAYRGENYRLRVDRTGPDTYRIHGATTVDAQVDRVDAFERRMACGGRRHRVIAVTQDADFRIEVDGVAHTITRVDGAPVRAQWPALVSRVLVEKGQDVAEGDPIAVLESMKMVSTVTAPFAGRVLSVDVVANAQIERGATLLHLQSEHTGPVQPAREEVVDLGQLGAAHTAPGTDPVEVYRRLVNYLLGFDLDPTALRQLTAAHTALGTELAPDDATLMAEEDAFLDLFAEVGALYRPRMEGDTPDDEIDVSVNTQEYFLAFLQWLDAERAGLPEGYRARLERAMHRYGARGLGDGDLLEPTMFWMFRSFSRVPQVAPFVLTILSRRLVRLPVLRPIAGRETRRRLERLTAATQGRQQAIADLARDVEFHYFDEPVMDAFVAEVEGEMRAQLAALRADPTGPDRADQVARLVWCPQPMRSLLLESWLDNRDDPTAEDFRGAVLEANARRFYRIRNLHGLDTVTIDGFQMAFADYEHEGMAVHLMVAYCPLDDLPALSVAMARHFDGIPEEREIVVDLATWREGDQLDIDHAAEQVAELLTTCDFGRPLHRLDLTITNLTGDGPERDRTQHVTYRSGPDGGFVEEVLYRNLHPMLGKRLELWRLSNFALERLPSPEDIYLFLGVAHENPKDRRLFALAEVRDLVGVRDEETGRTFYPRLGRTGLEALAAMRTALSHYPPRERPAANRLVLSVRPTWDIPPEDWSPLAEQYELLARGAGLERLVLHVKIPTDTGGLATKVLFLDGIGKGLLSIRLGEAGPNPVRPLTPYAQKVLTAERFGAPYPFEIVRMLTPPSEEVGGFPTGDFVELDLDADGETLVPTDRPPGQNSAHLVVGLLTNRTHVVPEGMTRVAMLSDPTQGLGNLSEPECRRINACLAYALEHKIPVEWYAVSSGALIAMDSGTENMDWIALTLRRLIEYTQAGGEINIIVTGINVGGQPYWNAEATMLMHTKGILIMTPASQMVLTGKQALDFSGAVSADDNSGIGGYDRIMGPNGQGQYWAPSFADACKLLLQHYDYAYVVPGERFPRRRPTTDLKNRDVRLSPHEQVPGSTFKTVGDVFGLESNPDRKRPFDMRSVMRSVTDDDCQPIERWKHWVDSDTSIVWDATIGGIPVCMLGLESRTVPRKGFVPSYGPPAWTSGTLFPQSSRKTARAVNACSGNRPLVVLANLSGFDGSPESMRNWQLEYGAEIGRAITNFDGPIVFVVVSRYHGGAFVVFSKALTESMEIAAVEGSYASVIGGAPAAATVFARETKVRTEKDPRVVAAREELKGASGKQAGLLRGKLAQTSAEVRSEKLGEVADEFDSIHTIERALRVGSVDRIISAEDLRPYVIDALERGMARTLKNWEAED